MDRSRRRGYPRLVGAAVAALGLALVAGCGPGADATWRAPGSGAAGAASPEASALKITPATGSTNVSVLAPVAVQIDSGTLDAVTVANADGKPVHGELDAERRSWQSTEPLGYNRAYTVTATATAAGGQHVEQVSKFTTIKPRNLTLPYLRANDMHLLSERTTYGIGQPVIVHFDEPIPDRAAAEKSLEVTTNPPVEGRWHWMDKQELHWRPQSYWKPGTSVTVKAKVYGVDLGNGLYGQQDMQASFKIGPSHIAIADNNTHHMLVYVNGAMARDIPVSMGKGGYATSATGQTIDFWTRSGPHVVIQKTPTTHMTSASYGITDPKDPNYYDEVIKLTVQISYAGEYVHLADWNIWAHGHANTSHGCINVGPSNIQWFYDLFQPGDVVEVKNTPKTLPVRDGLGDWTVPWSQW